MFSRATLLRDFLLFTAGSILVIAYIKIRLLTKLVSSFYFDVIESSFLKIVAQRPSWLSIYMLELSSDYGLNKLLFSFCKNWSELSENRLRAANRISFRCLVEKYGSIGNIKT